MNRTASVVMLLENSVIKPKYFQIMGWAFTSETCNNTHTHTHTQKHTHRLYSCSQARLDTGYAR